MPVGKDVGKPDQPAGQPEKPKVEPGFFEKRNQVVPPPEPTPPEPEPLVPNPESDGETSEDQTSPAKERDSVADTSKSPQRRSRR